MPGVLKKDVFGLEVAVYRVLDVAEVVEREGNLGKQRNGNNYFRGVKLDDGKRAALSLVPIVSWS